MKTAHQCTVATGPGQSAHLSHTTAVHGRHARPPPQCCRGGGNGAVRGGDKDQVAAVDHRLRVGRHAAVDGTGQYTGIGRCGTGDGAHAQADASQAPGKCFTQAASADKTDAKVVGRWKRYGRGHMSNRFARPGLEALKRVDLWHGSQTGRLQHRHAPIAYRKQ